MSSTHPVNPFVRGGREVIALGDNVIVSDMYFGDQISRAGLVIINDDSTERGIKPRWAKVHAIGPNNKNDDIALDKWVLISHGRWSRAFNLEMIDGKIIEIRRVDPKDILLVYNGEGRPAEMY